MKAFLLAAGLGTRLRPYTDQRPKCLMPINGRPLLDIWLALLDRHGVAEVLINTHHHADQVSDFIASRRARYNLGVTLVNEPQLLGSAGTVWANRTFVKMESDFIIAYADNLTNVDLTALVTAHDRYVKAGGVLTMGLFKAPQPALCGIAETDAAGRIIRFVEKPSAPRSDLANGGIYVASETLLNIMAEVKETHPEGVFDFGFHLLPALKGKMFGYEIKQYLKDIGTIEAYQQAQKEWPPQKER